MVQEASVRSGRTGQDMLPLIEEQQSSNMSVKAFCALHAISEARYYYWRKRYLAKKDVGVQQNDSFSLLQLRETDVTTLPGLFAEVNGIKLYREVPAAYLKALL